MKFERFISTFVMMNIVLMLAVVFSAKNEIFMEAAAQLVYGNKVDAGYFELPPENMKKDIAEKYMEQVFEKTEISREMLDATSALAPYDRAVAIIKIFSLMGDGECLTGLTPAEKINKMTEKTGCSKDFAQVFSLLAEYTGLKTRIVSNGEYFANEIYDGAKWVYTDPYFAMSVSGKNGLMSYVQFAEAMTESGWMKFNYFGGEYHCMSGKPIEDHPYFGSKNSFYSVYAYKWESIAGVFATEQRLKDRALFIKKLGAYKGKSPELYYTEKADSPDSIIRKYVAAWLAVLAVISVGTNLVLPVWYLSGLIARFTAR